MATIEQAQQALWSVAEDVMVITARRIAEQSVTNPAKARDDYQQHASAMSAEEISMFNSAIARAKMAMDEAAHS